MPTNISEGNLHRLFSEAYQWLCRSRKGHPPSSDIWLFRRDWKHQAHRVIDRFIQGRHQFAVQQRITLAQGETVALWSACDALMLKVLTRIIQTLLKPFLSKNCYHLKGHGGLKGAVRNVIEEYGKYRFFCKTDVLSYYASIDQYTLLMRLYAYVSDRRIIGYVWQFLNRCVEWGGTYRDIQRGIPRGTSLSPLLGAFYLLDLDREMEGLDVKYFRYMDDILILASTRWKLKRAIRVLNQTFNALHLEQHPDKTLIGRTEQGFDFLGYHFGPEGLTIDEKTLNNFVERAIRLYEQGPGEPCGSTRPGEYVKRWRAWAHGAVNTKDLKHTPCAPSI